MAQRVVLSSLLCSLILLNYISFSFAVFKQFAAPQISVPGCVDLALNFSLFCSPFDRFASAKGLYHTLSWEHVCLGLGRLYSSLFLGSDLAQERVISWWQWEERTQLPVGRHIIWSKREELLLLQRKKNYSNILIWVGAFWGFHL